MQFGISFKVNAAIYLKDPEGSELGKKLIKKSIDLINEIGFEAFNFKKLAVEAGTTEATIYRYFENKHRILLYIINWYWCYMYYLLDYQLLNIANAQQKLEIVIRLLTHELPESSGGLDYNKKLLSEIVISESSKVYLIKEISEINKNDVFKPYKDLCSKIADIVSQYDGEYKFPKSLSSTIIETAHQQQYFCKYLPKLTDSIASSKEFTYSYLENLVFNVLTKKPQH
jgi:hypothetical protein